MEMFRLVFITEVLLLSLRPSDWRLLPRRRLPARRRPLCRRDGSGHRPERSAAEKSHGLVARLAASHPEIFPQNTPLPRTPSLPFHSSWLDRNEPCSVVPKWTKAGEVGWGGKWAAR